MKTRLKLFVIAAGIAIGLVRIGWAFEYEVEGRLENEGFLAEGKSVKGSTFFTASVDGCRWLIRIDSEGSGEVQGYRQMSFDGKDMYIFGLGPDASGKKARWGGAVRAESVPYFGPTPTMPVIWLALASSCYLDRHSMTLTPPYSVDLVRPELVVQVARDTSGARLPRSIVFMDDGYERSEGKPRKRRPPYDKGFTNAVFSASAFMKAGDTEVPRVFQLFVFRPGSAGKSSSDLEIAQVFKGAVTNIRAYCSITNFVPEIPARTKGYIGDTRLASAEAIFPEEFRYRSATWLSTDQVRQLPGFVSYSKAQAARKDFVPILVNRQNKVSRVPAQGIPHVRFIVLCAMVSSMILGMFVYIKTKKRKNNREN